MSTPTASNTVADAGFVRADTFSAAPYAGFDWRSYAVKPADPTDTLDEGDAIDLGDRAFRVLHLPGHSPGSIVLWETATQTLFSGDAIYDGDLIDTFAHSDPATYNETMARLKAMDVNVVHAGHNHSFGKVQMDRIIDEYVAGGRRLGDPSDWIGGQTG